MLQLIRPKFSRDVKDIRNLGAFIPHMCHISKINIQLISFKRKSAAVLLLVVLVYRNVKNIRHFGVDLTTDLIFT